MPQRLRTGIAIGTNPCRAGKQTRQRRRTRKATIADPFTDEYEHSRCLDRRNARNGRSVPAGMSPPARLAGIGWCRGPGGANRSDAGPLPARDRRHRLAQVPDHPRRHAGDAERDALRRAPRRQDRRRRRDAGGDLARGIPALHGRRRRHAGRGAREDRGALPALQGPHGEARGHHPDARIREGDQVDAIIEHIKSDPEIGVLVLGAGTDKAGPGPLVAR